MRAIYLFSPYFKMFCKTSIMKYVLVIIVFCPYLSASKWKLVLKTVCT